MKNLLFIVFLISLPLNAASWTPSASLSALWEGNIHSPGLDESRSLMSSVTAEAIADPFSFKVEKHKFSLPLLFSYSSASLVSGRLMRLPAISAGAGIGYSYSFLNWLEAGGSLNLIMRWMEKADAAEWVIGGRLYASFSILPYLSLIVPLSLEGGRNSLTLKTGIGVRLMPGESI